MPDIECGKELTDLRSANLPHDQPVRPHPQGLPDQVGHGDQAVSLDIRRAALEMHHVTMRWTQLGDILDEHDSLVGRAEGDQPAEQGGLARPGAATHEEGALAGHHGHENRGHRPVSYTHLTLPTSDLVEVPVGAGSFNKKSKNTHDHKQ